MSAVTDGAGLAGGLDRRVRASVPRLRLEASPEAGRFLVATEALEAGCAVWTEAPLAWAPRLASTPSNAALCHHCFARAEKPQRCSACHSAQFCSRACQLQSWGRYHKLECARVLNWKSEGRQRSLLSPTILLAARIAFTRAMGADKAKDLPSGAVPVQWTLEQWGELGDHLDQFSAERKAQLAQAAAIAADFVGTEIAESTELGPKVFYRWLALFHCNNLSISDPESKEVGIGCYPLTALLNHSCAPNCAVIFVPASEPPSTNPSDPATQCGVLARVRTLRRIAAGETLSIAYIDVAASASVRRSQLRREYFFDCACPRCTDPAESARDAVLDGFRCSRPECASELALVAAKTGDGGPAAQGAEDGQDPLLMCAACQHVYPKADLLAAQHEATCALAKAYLAMGLPSTSVLSAYLPPSAAEDPLPPTPGPSAPSDQRALVGSAVRLLSAVLHPRHTLILRALDLSLRLSLQLEDWRAAEHAARELLPRYEFAYPPGHPLVTLHLLTLGKLLHFLGRSDTKEAAESLARAAEGCRRVFGSGHPMAREADRLAGEAAAEHAAQLRGGMFDA